MIPTTNPITAEMVVRSATTNSVTELEKLEKAFDNYNHNYLPKMLEKINPSVNELFFESETMISIQNSEVQELDIVDNDVFLKLITTKYNEESGESEKTEVSLFFKNMTDLKAEFEGSPMTVDYLKEKMNLRMLYDIYFDIKVLADGTVEHLVDIYSFNEEDYSPDEEDLDLDDIEVLHLQFKFTDFSYITE